MKKIFLLLFVSSFACADCSIETQLNMIRPGASYTITSGTYAGIVWTDQVMMEPTPQEMDTALANCESAEVASVLAQAHTQADASAITGPDPVSTLQRAAALVIVDELNILRQRDIDRASDVAAATSLTNLQTRWAARSALNLRTPNQIEGAIQAKIDSGAAD